MINKSEMTKKIDEFIKKEFGTEAKIAISPNLQRFYGSESKTLSYLVDIQFETVF
jgi:hypothetical protein